MNYKFFAIITKQKRTPLEIHTGILSFHELFLHPLSVNRARFCAHPAPFLSIFLIFGPFLMIFQSSTVPIATLKNHHNGQNMRKIKKTPSSS